MSTNPYATPKAQVSDERTFVTGNFVPHGRAANAGDGWDWIASGWDLFKKTPWLWIGIAVVFLVGALVLTVIPFGQLALTVLGPVFAGGLVSASRTLDQGGEVEFGDFFAGFKDHTGALIGVGAISLIISTVVFVGVFAIMGVGVFAMMGGNTDPQAMMAMGLSMVLAALIAVALLLPLAMATWFAAPLVMFHDMGPLDAMKASFVGCLKNVVAFLLYGVVMFLAMIVASIPAGLGWLVLGPVIAASVYTSYRDIYFTE